MHSWQNCQYLTNMCPMESSPWVGNVWFCVLWLWQKKITFKTYDFVFRNAKRIESWGGICFGGCWSGCQKRGSDRDKKGSSKDVSFCCVNPEMWNSSETIELNSIPEVTSILKKHQRSGKLETRKMVQSTGEMSTESAEQSLGKKKNKESQWAKYSEVL